METFLNSKFVSVEGFASYREQDWSYPRVPNIWKTGPMTGREKAGKR